MSDDSFTRELGPTLPSRARRSLNHCNLPAVILGSLTFQQHPTPLRIDGVAVLHRELIERLAALDDPAARAQQFIDYVNVRFLLDRPEEAGWQAGMKADRRKANHLGVIRGWMFDSNGQEAAVLKGWVESRFGLLPRYHGGPIRSPADDAYVAYQEAWASGVYNTHALESQLDLLFTYCQLELERRHPGQTHLPLFRGVTRLDEHEVLASHGKRRTVILNNLTSFTTSRERADEFGDIILAADVPLSKIAFASGLLPKLLQGEHEVAVLGGVYDVALTT
jgi:NAD+--dinitrogen-reductase ADP-D-ribosyltransferase